MKAWACGWLVVLFLTGGANAAMVGLDGEAPDVWESHSLVYGDVESVAEAGPSEYRVTFRPVAALAGSMQCALVARFDAIMFVGLTSVIPAPPVAGAHCIILVREKRGPAGRSVYYILSGPVFFMPRGQAVVKVSGIDDPVVARIAEAVRKAREEGVRKRAQEVRDSAEER